MSLLEITENKIIDFLDEEKKTIEVKPLEDMSEVTLKEIGKISDLFAKLRAFEEYKESDHV